ncbi:MAG: FAD-dependent oxidoreductase [Candidatus Sumerlaeota bacterium]
MRVDEIRKNIPEDNADYDVIVCGGGPAGLGAAWASAKAGAKTLLIEARSFFGGVAQIGLWMPMNRMFNRGKSRGGVHEAFIKIFDQYQPDSYIPGIENKIAKDGLDIHPDYLRLCAYELLESVGCHYLLYSPVIGVTMDGDAVREVEVQQKEGTARFAAKVFIDATGDADVAFLAGAPVEKGRAEDGLMMPMSLSFALSNVDPDTILAHANDADKRAVMEAAVQEAGKEGYQVARWYFFDKTTVPGTISVNNGGPLETWDKNMDGTQTRDINVIDRLGVKIAVDFVRIARERKLPGLENCSLMRVGPHPGVRETRRIIGDYTLSETDAFEGAQFDDVISVRYGDHADSQNIKLERHEVFYGHHFPWRSCLPRGIDGLAVVGRCAAASQTALTAARSMGNMLAMGQGAGAAAAVAAIDGQDTRKADITKAQKFLENQGVDLNR